MPAVIESPRLIAVAASRSWWITERQPKQGLHFVGAAEQ
jgi:hypothetical protein